MTISYCDKCGTPLDSNSVAVMFTGAVFDMMAVCPECAHKLQERQMVIPAPEHYCDICGKPAWPLLPVAGVECCAECAKEGKDLIEKWKEGKRHAD